MTGPGYSTSASLMGRLPISLTATSGTLTLADGRLSFVTRRGVVFDEPVSEFHSVAASARVGLHLWHRDRCYKFVPGHEIITDWASRNDVVDLGMSVRNVARATAADHRMQAHRNRWIEQLSPLVGAPPPGVTVRSPWPTWAVMLVVVGMTALLVAAIVAVAIATG